MIRFVRIVLTILLILQVSREVGFWTTVAFGVLFGGLFSATSLLFFALGKNKAGYMLGVAGALTGAVLGAIRIIASSES